MSYSVWKRFCILAQWPSFRSIAMPMSLTAFSIIAMIALHLYPQATVPIACVVTAVGMVASVLILAGRLNFSR
ncbi:hypothetical protein C7401_102285 [Paraburkholderia unamae]|nr:hypothetical protein C7401_102285 [Paraburkholderia unamae]